MMVINNKYILGEIVYLITDEEQKRRVVCSIKVYPGELIYVLTCGTTISEHYDFEMSETEDVEYKVK